MGYVSKTEVRDEVAELMSMGWEALGQVVQRRTLDAVAQHFLTIGLAEICLEALNDADDPSDPVDPNLESKGPRGLRSAACDRTEGSEGDRE